MGLGGGSEKGVWTGEVLSRDRRPVSLEEDILIPLLENIGRPVSEISWRPKTIRSWSCR